MTCMGRPGLWLRAGLDGTICGLDRAAARMPPGADAEGADAMLDAVEAGFLAGLIEAREQAKPQGGSR